MSGIDVFARLDGGEDLRKALRRLEPQMMEALARELPAEGNKLMGQANVLAPRGSGELVGSASVTSVVSKSGHRVRVAAAYLLERAAAVHEGIHWGKKVGGTRGFKWFERAWNTFQDDAISRLAGALRGVLERSR